jgi:hypothetical protein
MAEPTTAIDTSILDELVAIRRQQHQLTDYRNRAEQRRSQVDAAVFGRVLEDYARREGSLNDQAAPLEARARVEFRKLQATSAEVTRRKQAAELDKAEIEFRHEVGEIDDDHQASRLAGPEKILADCKEQLASLEALERRFAEAYPDVERAAADESPAAEGKAAAAQPPAAATSPEAAEAAAGSVAAEPEAEAPEVEEVVAEEDEEDEGTAVAFAEPSHPPGPAEGPPPKQDEGPASGHREPLAPHIYQAPTVMVAVPAELFTPSPATREVPALQPPVAEAAPDDRTRDEADATFILPEAALTLRGDPPVEFRLGALNYIGRADDNQVRIKSGDVSRRHAVVSVANGTYVLRDLQSQNGTFVNGHRIAEQPLNDGDRIRIGNTELVFHLLAYGGGGGHEGAGRAYSTPRS